MLLLRLDVLPEHVSQTLLYIGQFYDFFVSLATARRGQEGLTLIELELNGLFHNLQLSPKLFKRDAR